MGKIKYLILLAVLLLTGCYASFIKDGFRKTDYCYDGTNTEIGKKIKLNGYYELTHEYTTTRFYPPSGNPLGKLEKETSNNLSTVKYAFYSNGIAVLGFYKVENQYWGEFVRYIIIGDTIKTLRANKGMSQELVYHKFLIINDTTIEFLGKSYDKEPNADRIERFRNGNTDSLKSAEKYSFAHFIASDSLPDSSLMELTKYKWFWCNKLLYKAWKTEKSAKPNK